MKLSKRFHVVLAFGLLLGLGAASGTGDQREDKFRQLDEVLPTPNVYRTASGAPGKEYWQQKVDYAIDVAIDDQKQHLTGSERIEYTNNSPDTLSYLWVQLDPNIFSPESHAVLTSLAPDLTSSSYERIENMISRPDFDGAADVTSVRDFNGNPLPKTIVGTMMRVDLPAPLAHGEQFRFVIDWNYAINDHGKLGGRTGFEYFEKDGNYLYEMAQWFPRLCAYTDVTGWQNKQFLGRGEFTLEFGDYLVRITVPEDHIVASTGVLQNPDAVLSDAQKARLEEARTAAEPIFIVTPDEAEANETNEPAGTKTWVYRASNVRDFAFASSRKFIWDAKLQRVGDKDVWAMSYWPKEGEPLWSRYSTHSILHTLDVYSKFTFDYPYPVAISVNGPVGGMEYPMICFNGPRPEEDGTYSSRTKYGLISVIIHEVGHNWFPMIVNSDERQWTWMDEGLNTFVQYLAEQEWEDDYPSWRGEPQRIVDYMASENQVPIMTNSESILQFGANAYAKPATALNILRESIMGRELFDFAFKEYSNRWRFKRPEPADLFRTLEDASAVDLDWFFRGWFFTTQHTDLALDGIELYRLSTRDPQIEKPLALAKRESAPETLSQRRNQPLPKRIAAYPSLADFYNRYDELDVTEEDIDTYAKLVEGLSESERALLDSDLRFYVVGVTNEGGLPMPVVLGLHYEDGTVEEQRIPAEIWRSNSSSVKTMVMTTKPLVGVVLDPHLETADVDLVDNFYPRRIEENRVELDRGRGGRRGGGTNPMQAAAKAAAKAQEAAAETEPSSGSGD